MGRGRCVQLAGLFLACWGGLQNAEAGIHIDAFFSEYEFPSTNYFNLMETKWRSYDGILNGYAAVLPSLDLEEVFGNRASEFGNWTNGSNETEDDDSLIPFHVPEDWENVPKFMVVDFGAFSFEEAMPNTTAAAEKVGADFVIVVLGSNVTWRQRLSFWWSHRFPGSPTGEIPPGGNMTNPHYFMAVGAGEGSTIIELLEQNERFYGNSTFDEFYFGIDNFNSVDGQDFLFRLLVYFLWVVFLHKYSGRNGERSRPGYRRFTGEDLGLGEIQPNSDLQDCPVCLETMQVGETVRILPCRHMLHHDCITGWFEHGKYSCPLCKVDLQPHLEEQHNASIGITAARHRWRWHMWPFRRRILNDDAESQLIVDDRTINSNTGDLGDLELTVDYSSSPGVVV